MIKIFFVKSKEISYCPICSGELSVRSSKNRKVIKDDGTKDTYRLRVLKCSSCGKIHTELPDFIQPFKHYESEVIETVIDGEGYSCPAEESTQRHWRIQFTKKANQIDGMLTSIWMEIKMIPAKLMHKVSLLKKIRKTGSGWLRVVMRQLVNSGKYIHT